MATTLTTDNIVEVPERVNMTTVEDTDNFLVYDVSEDVIKKITKSVLKEVLGIDAINNPTESKSGNGYVTLPSGIIIQWGEETMPTSTTTFTFSIPFPNYTFYVGGSITEFGNCPIWSFTTTDFKATTDSTATTASKFHWVAIGY